MSEGGLDQNPEAEGEGEGDEIDDEQMIDIAESCLIKIAEALITHNISIRVLFQDEILTEEIEGQ